MTQMNTTNEYEDDMIFFNVHNEYFVKTNISWPILTTPEITNPLHS